MASGIANRVDENVYYGVFVDADHAGDGHYRYWVATEVSSFGDRPEQLVELTIPAGTYAMVRVEGGPERIDEGYMALARAIGAATGSASVTRYGFERYDVRRQAPTPPYERFDYDVYRPIAATVHPHRGVTPVEAAPA
jgi:predicted transcriptional regulator YdeE